MFRRAKSADAGEQLLSGDRRGRRRERKAAMARDRRAAELADAAGEPAGTSGPWDVSDVGPEQREALLDVGSLLLPVVDDMEIRLQLDQESQEVLGVLAVFGDSALEVRAFAAPRSAGLWDDVRREVAAETTRHGGVASDGDGPFGTELVLTVAATDERGRPVNQQQRMWGVDGPRWMLRVSVIGAAAVEPSPERLEPLEQFVRGIVVVRGKDPMAPREPLPLIMPTDLDADPEDGSGADQTPDSSAGSSQMGDR